MFIRSRFPAYSEEVIRDEIFSPERLGQFATYLAPKLIVTKSLRSGISLLSKVKANHRLLIEAYRELTDSKGKGGDISPAAEWILDNFHVIENQIQEIRHDLPDKFYGELPKLSESELKGYPRVYAIALAILSHTDSRLETETLKHFLVAYQTVSPLKIGELWAMAIHLRIALVENINRVAGEILRGDRLKRKVEAIVDSALSLRAASALEIQKHAHQIRVLLGKASPDEYVLLSLLTQRLRDQDPKFQCLLEEIQDYCASRGQTIEKVILQGHQLQSAAQATARNIILSMRLLSTIDWKEFFESVSLVDRILCLDPSLAYPLMDFESRNRYRNVVERIAKRSGAEEIAISATAIELATRAKESIGSEGRKKHVGYFLVDQGLKELEKVFHYSPTFAERARRSLIARPYLTYFVAAFVLLIAGVLPFQYYSWRLGIPWWAAVSIAALTLMPVSDVALNFVNLMISLFLPPRVLQKLDFTKGIPENAKTLVAVPIIFSDTVAIRSAIEKLEIRFMGNPDPNLTFAILSDFPDAKEETTSSDETVLETLRTGFNELNLRHPGLHPKFFFFHRKRLWSPSEQKWLGWERKRGKLHELNRFLRGHNDTTFMESPEFGPRFAEIKYVITLDADTQLPRDCARKLVGTICHPLNIPYIDPKSQLVTKGFGILQPRVSVSLDSSNLSLFSRVFSGHTGIDPYSMAVSDTYQDLFGAGSYTGKGLYSVDAFEAALADRTPGETLLSHDLFEGEYARTALLSDVELIDDYPARYEAFSMRQHRWTRGDWQLLDRVSTHVRNEKGEWVGNSLSLISRWKILDNLRRSLIAPFLLLWLVLAWSILPGNSALWTLAVLSLLILPPYAHATSGLLLSPRGIPWTSNFWNVWGNFWTNMMQVFLDICFLAHQAYLQLDAIVRTLYRKGVSHRKLLEWSTAESLEKLCGPSIATFGGFIWASPLLAILILAVLRVIAPARILYASPFLTAWLFLPFIARWISRPLSPKTERLKGAEKREILLLARSAWSFFDTYTGDTTHWLPPDNVQFDPTTVIAERTSPTNIGLLLLSTASAHELGFITEQQCIERLEKTLATLKKLERYHGHFLNWYDVATLKPLEPRYVSTVDSGNLAGHLIVVKQLLLRLQRSPGPLSTRCQHLAREFQALVSEMDFTILFDPAKKLFSIGLHVNGGKQDESYYDLLASEARLASFIAIGLGQVPQMHWFHLGRQLTSSHRQRILISWSASMFEYLMPLLVMRQYPNTILEETHHAATHLQIGYGKRRGVPWGVSESGYNARDFQQNYQYGPFGIPGLGLRRSPKDELVIAPYATALAALVAPRKALRNFRRMEKEGWSGKCGFFEAADYTKSRLRAGMKFALIRSHMAHHQGMSLCAFANVLRENVLQNLFHSDALVIATEALLQERLPQKVEIQYPRQEKIRVEAKVTGKWKEGVRRISTPSSSQPKTQILSNGTYTVMINSAGSGFSRYGDLAVTRWRDDPTLNSSGFFVYLRDKSSGELWSATHSPVGKIPDAFETIFSEHKAEFHRRDGHVHTTMEIVVSPGDCVELRRITISNRSLEKRVLELTSYLEPVLLKQEDDLAHMAFSKLFFQTELIESKHAILGRRRRRSDTETENWVFHLAVGDPKLEHCEYETDRLRFLGRNHTLSDPAALETQEPFSGTAGDVLDPIFSLRTHIPLHPGQSAKLCFITGVAPSRDEALAMIDRYHEPHSFSRESDMAWTRSQMEIRHLNVDAEDACLFQEVASVLFYSDRRLRPTQSDLRLSTLSQPSLWAQGISGDLPILVVRAKTGLDLPLVRHLLRAHEYLRMKGIIFDLVILNEELITYRMALQDDILYVIRAHGNQGLLQQNGGVFVLRAGLITAPERFLLESAARAVFTPERGSLKEQVSALSKESEPQNMKFTATQLPEKTPAKHSLQVPPLDCFNGYGGFSKEGREYVIHLDAGRSTPAPWSNVVANERGFGFLITESGAGYTWSQNSSENKLTPWSNDPVGDPAGEIIYLRDEDTGAVWPTTPVARRNGESFLVKHGQGYSNFKHASHGIHHSLTAFVPREEEVKIYSLRLKNTGNQARRLSSFFYVEWVLGTNRSKSAHHVQTEIGAIPGILIAQNSFDAEFGGRIAFASALEGNASFTCDRREFLGQSGSYEQPVGTRQAMLSNRSGPGLDPCAAFQNGFSLEAGEEKEIIFLLGQCETAEKVEPLVTHYSQPANAAKSLDDVKEFWDSTLGAIQVHTPDAGLNFLLNRWLLYQTLSCRIWGRAAFYQAGGAYGFRDQLQDVLALLHSRPAIARQHILEAARHQFTEGDVLHWWHPPAGRGVRTHISDDLLWLVYSACQYASVTGDSGIFEERISFLTGPPLAPNKEDHYFLPEAAEGTATLFEHCQRAIEHSMKVGSHGLPLMGAGDWDDGMNRVGQGGKGESVWLAWFLAKVLADFAPLCDSRRLSSLGDSCRKHKDQLKQSIETNAWDGEWYLRAFFDDGSPLGSKANEECQIASIAQSWAVLSGQGDPARSRAAMGAVAEHLVLNEQKLVLLFTPPFSKSAEDPGYIKGYAPGIRENGGQYTHAAVWAMMAFADLGDRKNAEDVLSILNPINHSASPAQVEKYLVEPYVEVADIYGVPPHVGRGGWTWYTGSAGWLYQGGLGYILGLRREDDILRFFPCAPAAWDQYKVAYRFGKTTYEILFFNKPALSHETLALKLDGFPLKIAEIHLIDDGRNHEVHVSTGA